MTPCKSFGTTTWVSPLYATRRGYDPRRVTITLSRHLSSMTSSTKPRRIIRQIARRAALYSTSLSFASVKRSYSWMVTKRNTRALIRPRLSGLRKAHVSMRKDLHWFLLLSITQLVEVPSAVSDFHHLFLRALYQLVSRAKRHQRYDQSSTKTLYL